MDKDLLMRLGITNTAAEFLKDQLATREALELMNPRAQAAREIARMQDAIDPMRALRQSELARYGDLNEALKRYEDQYLASPLRAYAEIEKASALAQAALQYEASRGYLPDPTLEALERSSRFTLPAVSTAQAYLEAYDKERADLLKATRASLLDGGLRDALAQMQSPWLDLNDINGSIRGVAGLRELGQSLSALQPFDIENTRLVREALGDWRDFSTPLSRATLPTADREVLYDERGLNPTLVRFPAEAFDELTDDAGLSAESDAVFALFDADLPVIDVSQSALQRATFAFERLLRFEIYLRRFIHDAMTQAFGEKWPKHQLPPVIYKDWMDKQSKAQAKGGSVGLLIDQADFTHYLMIIQRNDNWKTVFEPLFQRREDVVESLQRLAPLRLDTMHARPMNITNADLLMLYVETTRIVRAARLFAARLN